MRTDVSTRAAVAFPQPAAQSPAKRLHVGRAIERTALPGAEALGGRRGRALHVGPVDGSADQLGHRKAAHLREGNEFRVLLVVQRDLRSMSHDVMLHHSPYSRPDELRVSAWSARPDLWERVLRVTSGPSRSLAESYPQPARRLSANASGSKGRRSCRPSPRPTSLTGTPISSLTARTMPPLAVPSSLVRATPVRGTELVNSRAWAMPFWPVVASMTSRTSCTSPAAFSRTRLTLANSAMRGWRVCRRPAVSTIRTSSPRAFADPTASKATAPGSAPRVWVTMCAPARPAHTVSCSPAAARKVSLLARPTLRPCPVRYAASLPIVVVFPAPLTPTTMITVSSPGIRCRVLSPPSAEATSSAIRTAGSDPSS